MFAVRRALLCVPILLLLAGCATPRPPIGSRPFDFQEDTFAFANELKWEYHYDENGDWVHHRRQPPPSYAFHCFVLARSARQFFQNARFDPAQRRVGEDEYRRLIRRVVGTDPRFGLREKVVIPGYGDLREFSMAQEKLLKEECGGGWQSYLQRGNWRMIFPFLRAHQARAAERLMADLREGRPPVVHVVRFPNLDINHALLVFAAREAGNEIRFSVYDPNQPAAPRTLAFDRARRRFSFPANNYFPGGPVNVYEVYRSWNY